MVVTYDGGFSDPKFVSRLTRLEHCDARTDVEAELGPTPNESVVLLQLLLTANFALAPADYNIEIPSLVRDNIAKSVDVKVLMTCTLLP